MKTIRPIFLLLLYAGTTWAQTNIVVPNNLANVEGNSSVSEPFNSTSFRFQQVFDASQFAIPPGMSGRIDSISFRIDGASTSRVLLFFGGSSVTLSTTARGPDGLSSIFAENLGVDAASIYNGGLSLGSFVQPGVSPQPFKEAAPRFGADTFYYDPTKGNLLLDFAGFGGEAFLPGSLDAHSVIADGISWVWSPDGNSASGIANTVGLVTRFDFTLVPEPSVGALGLAGLVLLAVFRRR